MPKRDLVNRHREEILALAAKFEIESIKLFGSVARGDERPDSDIDFLVRRKPGSDPFFMLDLKEGLEALLGCKIDLITDQPLMRARLRGSIERDLVPL
ncbi:nucleotidyltransferase family protein [Haloferula sargassicola]|uniref:Polymerase beta nucleotidyltransferase domain-containing protein n=1 Tax=Haloferula sargassicola TaxID=490096 RepID=A0ABP9ULM5_9BACT